MILSSRALGSSAAGLLVGASLVVAACGASDEKRATGRSEAGSGGEAGGDAGHGGLGAGSPAAVGGEGGTDSVPSESARAILGLPTELEVAVVCGAPRAATTLVVFNGSDERVTVERVDIDGPFSLETELPLRIAPGESQSLEVKTTPGVVGTDKPGDQRTGALSVVSSVGDVSVALRGTVRGSTVSVDSIPGAPLSGPLEFACSSAGDTCPTRSFHVVNTGDSPVELSAPVGENDVVAAFVPGAPTLTLRPGAGVKVELRAAAGASVSAPGVDALTLAVQGSCEFDELRVETRITSLDPCQCAAASPGVQAGSFAHDYECGDGRTFAIPIFNGAAEDASIDELANDYVESVPNQLPLTLPRGKTTWLELLPSAQLYPGSPVSVRIPLSGPGGALTASGTLDPSGSWLSLQNVVGGGLPATLELGCGPTTLQVYNAGNTSAEVRPPVLNGAVTTDFVAPQTILPQESYTFHVGARSNAENACATAGNLAFAPVPNDCVGDSLALSTSYQGPCTCDGL